MVRNKKEDYKKQLLTDLSEILISSAGEKPNTMES